MIDNRLTGKKIAAMRQKSAMTQQQLAAMMNVSHQAVSKWESGQALPDIETLLELTRFFGVTVEQLVTDCNEETPACSEKSWDVYQDAAFSDTTIEEPAQESKNETEIQEQEGGEREDFGESKEEKHMSIQQLLQMAPFMSKETVEEIAMEIEENMTAAQLARLAPYLRPECVEKLIEKHRPEFTWDSLRRVAPFMRREAVDELARAIANGRESVKPASESLNKTINDIGKAFDDLGKGVGRAMKKAVRFGESVINEVSSAISERTSETPAPEEAPLRSQRAMELRKMAFERALADGKWDWIGAHISEIEGEQELMDKIASRAREEEMEAWIRRFMGAYADENAIEAAISGGDWAWLGENVEKLEPCVQSRAALAAAKAGEWDWLEAHIGHMKIGDCAMELLAAANEALKFELITLIVREQLDEEAVKSLTKKCVDTQDYTLLPFLIERMDAQTLEMALGDMAKREKWQQVRLYVHYAEPASVEKLMEIAVEQGNFEAIDLLDAYL